MDELTSIKNPKRRRRALTWGIFGLAGVIMSTAWATGFGTSESGTTSSLAQNAFGEGATDPQSISAYANDVNVQVPPLSITFDGLWGQIADDTSVFQVDLSGYGIAERFYVDIYVDNLPFENQWSAAQFKWYQLPGACAPASYTDALDTTPVGPAVGEPKLMNITKSDAHVSFKELEGGQVYCFGIPETDLSTETDIALGEFLHADDQDGTFLTRPSSTLAPTAPNFTAIVNRSS